MDTRSGYGSAEWVADDELRGQSAGVAAFSGGCLLLWLAGPVRPSTPWSSWLAHVYHGGGSPCARG